MNKSSRDDKRAAFSTDMCNSKIETSFTETKFDSANQATCIVKADPEQQVSSPKKVARKTKVAHGISNSSVTKQLQKPIKEEIEGHSSINIGPFTQINQHGETDVGGGAGGGAYGGADGGSGGEASWGAGGGW